MLCSTRFNKCRFTITIAVDKFQTINKTVQLKPFGISENIFSESFYDSSSQHDQTKIFQM
jgi:hypothetical protein